MAKKNGNAQENTNELAIYDGEPYAVMQRDPKSLPEIFRSNIGEGQINDFDLPRVSMPGGGSAAWSVTDLSGEAQAENELRGVIVLHGDRRRFFLRSYDETGGGAPPDCYSQDGITGFGVRQPGQAPSACDCRSCPHAQFSDSEDETSRRPRCGQRKLLFLMRENEILPTVVDLSPASLKVFKQFAMRLTSRGIPLYSVVVGLRLTVHDKPKKHSRVAPRVLAELPPEQREKMKSVADALRPIFDRVTITQTEDVSED